MRYITVADFREQAEVQQITAAIVQRQPAGGYVLVLRLNWRDEEHLLVHHRDGTPREWSSLDRLLNFLEREEVRLPELVVKFLKE